MRPLFPTAALALTAFLAGCQSPPGAAVISLQPEAPTTLDELVVDIVEEAIDPNADTVSLAYRWLVDGEAQPELDGQTSVPADLTARGQSWTVEVTASDEKGEGGTVAASVTIVNSAPSAQVAIEPEQPGTNDDLAAIASGEDVDADEVSFTYAWTKNGEATTHDSSTVPAADTAAGEKWVVTATPADDELAGEAVTAEVTIGNTAPVVDSITLEPAEISRATGASAVVEASDFDGDDISLSFDWSINGSVVLTEADGVFAGELLTRGDLLSVSVTPSDAELAGEPLASSEVTVGNSVPSVASAAVDPGALVEASTATCAGTGWLDLDDDAAGYNVLWTVNGTEAGTSPELTGAAFSKGDEVVCALTPFDGIDEGEAAVSTAVVVGNTAPSAAGAALSESTLREATEVACQVSGWTDADGDSEDYLYHWFVDDTEVATTATLTGDAFDKGQSVYCTAEPFDGEDAGATVTSASALVLNTAPQLGAANITPPDASSGDDLQLELVGLTDVDGADSPSVRITWSVNGADVAEGDTLSSDAFAQGDTVYATVTPTDGTDDGVSVKSSEVEIRNHSPEVVSVAISPDTVMTETELTALVETRDADGDPVTIAYMWTVNGTEVGGDSATLSGLDHFDRDDSIVLSVTVSDEFDEGETQETSPVTVVNTPPTAPELSGEPVRWIEEGDITCVVAVDSTDADGDDVDYTFSWKVDGSDYLGSTEASVLDGDTIPVGTHAIDEEWTCTAVPSDGFDDGPAGEYASPILPPGVEFVDTTGDDVEQTFLLDYFESLGDVPSSSFIFFEVDTKGAGGIPGAWCGERADWYVDQYISTYGTSVVIQSEGWNKWTRTTTGSWTGPVTSTHSNYFGANCDGTVGSWCSEWGVNGGSGALNNAIMPGRADSLGESYARQWSNGRDWETTIRVAGTRAQACGF